MEFIYVILGISIPIFYIWGVIACIQTLFVKKPNTPQLPPWSQNLMRTLIARMEENPNVTVMQFLQEIGVVTIEKDTDEAIETDDELSFEEALADEPSTPRIASLIINPQPARPMQPAEPAFSWSNWYQDNAINLLLYLGAFLIVAAVTLFVGFQWENFNSITRFTIVILFTVAWYVAGFVANRFRGLELAGMTFITIGAILTPFCGVAYQRFMLGTMDGIGWTWLITSIVSTGIYLGLSLFYQRRYFTYFGNLSILAMILALVQINDAPQEYFILAGCATALMLLLGRLALRTMPKLDVYMGQDVEYSSLGILGVSVVLGLYLVPFYGIDFFSIEVLAVLVVTVIYLWVYSTIRIHPITVIAAQLCSVAAVAHALITFEASSIIVLYATLITHIGLQAFLNQWLKHDHADIYRLSNSASLIVTGALYIASVFFLFDTWYPLSFALVLMLHSAYYAQYLEMPIVFHLTAVMWYLVVAHILNEFNAPSLVWLIGLMAIAVVQVFAAYTQLDKRIQQAFVRIGLMAVGVMTFAALAFATRKFEIDNAITFNVIMGLLQMYVGFAVYAYFGYTESRAEIRLLTPLVHLLAPVIGVLCYFVTVGYEWHFIAASLSLIIGGLFIMAFRNNRHVVLVYLITASVYPAILHLLLGLHLPDEAYPIALSIVSLILFLLESGFPLLPQDAHRHRKYAVLIITTITTFYSFGFAVDSNSSSLHIAGWVSGYTLIALIWLGRSLFDRRAWDYLIGIVGLLQYYWHIYFLQVTVNEELFSNPQWYFAAAGTLALLLSMREQRRSTDTTLINALELSSALLFLLPTYGQSINSGSLLYFLLAIVYSLLFVGLGIMFSRRFLQQIGAVALIFATLLQSREFLLGLPRWLVVGVIGFAIMAAALYLSIRRRGEKRETL
jgi:hypothetical protein